MIPSEMSMLVWLRKIEEREAEYLRPANELLLREAVRLQEQNKVLRHLITRNQKVADRLKAALAEVQAEPNRKLEDAN
jgi:hypothetical protein